MSEPEKGVEVDLAVGSNGELKPLTVSQVIARMRSEIETIRSVRIPAAQATSTSAGLLSDSVPAAALAAIAGSRTDGALRRRFDELRGDNEDPFDAAVALMAEAVGFVKKDLEARAVAFANQGQREEGKAQALEEQVAILDLTETLAPSVRDVETPAE